MSKLVFQPNTTKNEITPFHPSLSLLIHQTKCT
jgi:hypothetical protein